MTYPQAIRFLESFINFEKLSCWNYKKSLKLKRISLFLDEINNPQSNLKYIHVAGSKGKGSTCAFIAYILRQAGFKVGLYTSPHLVDFRERIRILEPGLSGGQEFEGMIPKVRLRDLVQRLKPKVNKFNKTSSFGELTFFEIYTAVAFEYFKEENVDFVVLETGMGGRLDATNVVKPLVSVLTPISYEHTQKLGTTLSKIAFEKAGIIKHSPVVAAPQEKEVFKVFEKKCIQQKTKLTKIREKDWRDLKVSLIGEHQKVNAACAVRAVKSLAGYGIKIKDADIKKGLLATRWPCRCEVVSKDPTVILDGAQNAASVKALIDSIRKNFKYRSVILILGISDDKDIPGICRQLGSFVDRAIITKALNPRATHPLKIAGYFSREKVLITQNTKEAKKRALKIAKKEDLILVTGSLFVTGEFKR